jgi:amidase
VRTPPARNAGPLPFADPIGAFCQDNHVALAGAPRGPLAGGTFAAKDVFHIAGARTGFGHPAWLRTHDPATVTATAVQRLLDAGARMVGKTQTDEFAYSLTGENVHYGTPINVRAPDRIPGGSSSGSAAAVAAGIVDFALGTDCGGSVRLPASYCGILGVRPTVGRVSLDGVIPFGPPFDVVGWFARDSELLERVGQVLLDDPASPPTPLVEPRVADALAPAVAAIARHLGPPASISVSPEGLTVWFETFRVLQAASVWSNLGDWITRTKPELGPGVKERFEWAARVNAEDVAAAAARHLAIRGRLDELLVPGDVLCLPTSPRVAPLKRTPVDDLEIRYRHQAMHLLCIAGLGGLPQVTLPMAELDGLPLGLSLVGARGADLSLLALTRSLGAAASGPQPVGSEYSTEPHRVHGRA